MDIVSPSPVSRPQRRAQRRAWLWRALASRDSVAAFRETVALLEKRKPQPRAVSFPATGRAVVRAVIHAHTTYSDGRGDVREVAQAARRAGADVLILADHDTLQPLADGWEGHIEGVLVLVGCELRTDAGYVLALGLPADFHPTQRACELLPAIQAHGGLAYTALPAHPCVGWSQLPAGVTGLEVMNLHSLGSQSASLAALPQFCWLLATGRRMDAFGMLARRPRHELEQWDALLARGRAVGLASADAHGQVKVAGRPVEVPRYEESFRLVQTHLVLRSPLSGRLEADRRLVLDALGRGWCRLVYAHLGDADSFDFCYASGETLLTEGEEGRWTRTGRFIARAQDSRTLYRLFHDGALVEEAEGALVELAAPRPGVYRLEVSRYGGRVGRLRTRVRPWIFTNPIYLG